VSGPDYIIVGGGSAGCVLADRLSADGRHRVLLLEAGPADTSPFVHMPKGMARLFTDPSHIWYLQTEAQDDVPAETWLRGKLLGGSSSVNGMVYLRGHPQDYEDWAGLGAAGWGWDAMRRAFEAIEGPLQVSIDRRLTPLGDAFLRAGEEMGLKRVDDLNHPGQDGVGPVPRTIAGGRRSSAARAFLAPARNRLNLVVETGVTIDRLLLDGRRAVGVSGRKNGQPVDYRTAGEVILSAGALASPVILQRSGIGPAALLRAAGVEPLVDSPRIGANLLEHRLLMMEYGLKRPISDNVQYRGWRALRNGMRYLLTRGGRLASAAYEMGAFIRSRPGLDRPDAEVLMAPYSLAMNADGSPGVGTGHGIHLFGYPLRSRSAGSIHLASADPAQPAVVLPAYLTDPYDREVTVAMFRFIRRWLAQPALADIVAAENAPGCAVETDEQIIAAFRSRGQAGYHACGTVAMGGADSPLDPQLRVRGIERLRVIDGSVMPTMVSANTNGPIMALAWHTSTIVLGR